MPALTPEQRARQIKLAKDAKARADAKAKPKPGQKGQAQPKSSQPPKVRYSDQAVTTQPKPTAKPEKYGPPVPARLQQAPPPPPRPRSPAIGAPVHAKPSAFGSATKVEGGTLSGVGTSPYAPQVGQAPRPNTPQPSGGNYGADGKSLYNAGRGDNPLMQRMFGYQTGQAPDQVAAQQQQQPQVPTPQEPAMSPQYEGNDEPGKLGQADNPMKMLSDLLQRKKLTISASN